MKPFYVLTGAFIIASLVIKLAKKSHDYSLAGRLAMSIMLVFTAIAHFAYTKGMAAMIPPSIPMRIHLVFITGVLEMLFAIGLLWPMFLPLIAWGLIAFFLILLPANIYAAVHQINYQTGELNGPGVPYLWLRIPLQLFFIGWVYAFSISNKLRNTSPGDLSE